MRVYSPPPLNQNLLVSPSDTNPDSHSHSLSLVRSLSVHLIKHMLIYRCDHGVTTIDNTSDYIFTEEIPSEYISDLTEELQSSWSGLVNDRWDTTFV